MKDTKKDYYDDDMDYYSLKDKIAGEPFYAINGDGEKYHIKPFYSYETLVTLETEDEDSGQTHTFRLLKSDLYEWYNLYDINMELIHTRTIDQDEVEEEYIDESFEDKFPVKVQLEWGDEPMTLSDMEDLAIDYKVDVLKKRVVDGETVFLFQGSKANLNKFFRK